MLRKLVVLVWNVGLVGVKDTGRILNLKSWGLVDFHTNRIFAKFRLVKNIVSIKTIAMTNMMNYQFNVKCRLFVFRIKGIY